MRIYIECSGGLVRRVTSDIKNVEVAIIDYDVLEDENPDPEDLQYANEMNKAIEAWLENKQLHVNY